MARSLLSLLFICPILHADPLECMPKQASFVAKIESPRTLVEAAVNLDAWKGLRNFPQVKEQLDAANVRRLFQLLAHLETETGTRWPELLDKVAGNGIALGFKAGSEPAPMLAVIEGQDAAIVKKVYAIFVAGVKDEAAREGKTKIEEKAYEGISILSAGSDALFAQYGNRIFVSNKPEALQAGLQLARGSTKVQSVLKHRTFPTARKLVGPNAAAWFWFDLAAAKDTKEGKDFFENSQKEIFQYLVLGSSIDAARRSDFLAAGLYYTPRGYTFSIRLPAKSQDLEDAMRLHVPASGPGSKPLLEPPGVVASQSFYLDLSSFWKNRKTWVGNEERLKELEKGVDDISRILPNTTFGKILEQSGPHHRFVMAHTGEKLYAKEPGQPIPPVAYVGSFRDAELGPSLDGILRAAGLFASFQTGWKLKEEAHHGIKIATYRFPETDAKFPDEDNLRFNAAPSFAVLDNALIVGTTPGIVKSLIPILKAETDSAGAPEVWKFKLYAHGAGDVLAAHPESTITETILTQGISMAEAKSQVKDLVQWLGTLGNATASIHHGEDYYKVDIVWDYKK